MEVPHAQALDDDDRGDDRDDDGNGVAPMRSTPAGGGMPLSAFACDADSDATLRQLNRHKDATLLTPALAHRLPPAYRRQGANLTRKLMLLRQCGGKPQTHLGNTRTLYEHLVPNETHFHVDDEPAVAIRKFSPCGRYLVTFSKTPGVYSLVVFRLKRGTRSAEERPSHMWAHYFEEHFSTVISRGAVLLNKDFCLFSEGSRFLLVASTETAPRATAVHRPRQNPEALESLTVSENVTFYCVDLETGVITDQREILSDYVSLAHNTGAYLYRHYLAVLCLQSQQIRLFQLRDDGKLLDLMTIGEFCSDEDRHYLEQTQPACAAAQPFPPAMQTPTQLSDIMRRVATAAAADTLEPAQPAAALPPLPPLSLTRPPAFISGLKHRLLAFLYRQTHADPATAAARARSFHYSFNDFMDLCMWKMQLLDERRLLIKYGSAEQAGNRSHDLSGLVAFYVVFDFVTGDILSVYENNSPELLRLYTAHADIFHRAAFDEPGVRLTLPSNNVHARDQFEHVLHAVLTARNGGREQSVRRGLGTLPVACQNARVSPYFDLGLFSFDDKSISPTDRLKHATDYPARFYRRSTDGIAFRLQAGPQTPQRLPPRTKKLVSYVFHPYLPFVISVQHLILPHNGTSSHTNFHFRA